MEIFLRASFTSKIIPRFSVFFKSTRLLCLTNKATLLLSSVDSRSIWLVTRWVPLEPALSFRPLSTYNWVKITNVRYMIACKGLWWNSSLFARRRRKGNFCKGWKNTYELLDMHDDAREWYFLLFHSLSHQIVLEEMALVDIATDIATFLLFALESLLTLARTRA